MGFGIIQRSNGNGLWLEQEITETQFDSIIVNLVDTAKSCGKLDHEWGKFYDKNGNVVKSIRFKQLIGSNFAT